MWVRSSFLCVLALRGLSLCDKHYPLSLQHVIAILDHFNHLHYNRLFVCIMQFITVFNSPFCSDTTGAKNQTVEW